MDLRDFSEIYKEFCDDLEIFKIFNFCNEWYKNFGYTLAFYLGYVNEKNKDVFDYKNETENDDLKNVFIIAKENSLDKEVTEVFYLYAIGYKSLRDIYEGIRERFIIKTVDGLDKMLDYNVVVIYSELNDCLKHIDFVLNFLISK